MDHSPEGDHVLAPDDTLLTTRVTAAAAREGKLLDPAQRHLLAEIATLFTQNHETQDHETQDHEAQDHGTRSPAAQDPIPRTSIGAFVHGPAGRGKTWLSQSVFAAFPVDAQQKRRVHFHAFFQQLQQRFGAQLSARAAIDDTVAELLDGTRLFFFDELHIHDPGGAVLLNRLLDELVRRDIPTLITSNYEPEALLPNRVYHHVVEPGIRVIREHFLVHELDGGADYRRATRRPTLAAGGSDAGERPGFTSGRWITVGSLAEKPEVAGLVLPAPAEGTTVLDGHRALRARAVRGREVWFDFADLLEAPSVPDDYLELAQRFDTWVLSGVPPLSRASRAARHRLVMLLDVLVDADLSLTVLAETDRRGLVDIIDPPPDLFRAESRLALLTETATPAPAHGPASEAPAAAPTPA